MTAESDGSNTVENDSAPATADASTTPALTPVEWAPPSLEKKKATNGTEMNKNALMALQSAAMAAQEFDQKFELKNPSRESSVPLFLGDEMVISREPIRQVGYYAEYQLKGVRIILDLIPEGTFGSSIEEARNRFMERSIDGCYSAKYLQTGLLESDHGPTAAADMITEIRILMNLSAHPNIAPIYGVNQGGIDTLLEPGRKGFFLISDCITETLTERLDAWRCKTGYDNDSSSTRFNQRLEIALDMASALIFLHNRQLVYHLRPDKVGFDQRYSRIKLYNFSQARQDGMKEHSRSLTKSDDIATLAYTAPEILCRAPGTSSSDVYSFAILLWEMMSLRYPFDRYDRAMHFEQVVQNHKRPPMNRNWPDPLKKLLQGCWDPHLRLSMKQAHGSLESVLLFSSEAQQIPAKNNSSLQSPASGTRPRNSSRPRGGGGQLQHPSTPTNRSSRSSRTVGSRTSTGTPPGDHKGDASSPLQHQQNSPISRSNGSLRTAGSNNGTTTSPRQQPPRQQQQQQTHSHARSPPGGRRSVRRRQSTDTTSSTGLSHGSCLRQSVRSHDDGGCVAGVPLGRRGGKPRRRASIDYLPSSTMTNNISSASNDGGTGVHGLKAAPNLSGGGGSGFDGAPDSIHKMDQDDNENEEKHAGITADNLNNDKSHSKRGVGGRMAARVEAMRNRNMANPVTTAKNANGSARRKYPRSMSVGNTIPTSISVDQTISEVDASTSSSDLKSQAYTTAPMTPLSMNKPSVHVDYNSGSAHSTPVPFVPDDNGIAGGDHADLDDFPESPGQSSAITPRAMLRKLTSVANATTSLLYHSKDAKQQQQQEKDKLYPPEEHPVSKPQVSAPFGRFKRRSSC